MQGNRAEEFFKLSKNCFDWKLVQLIGANILIFLLVEPFLLFSGSIICFVMSAENSVIPAVIIHIAAIAVDIFIMKKLIAENKKKQQQVNEWVTSVSESELESAFHTLYFQKEFGVFCLMSDFLFIPSENEMIGYERIKAIHATDYRIMGIVSMGMDMRIELDNGKNVSVRLRCSPNEYKSCSDSFTAQLNVLKKDKIRRMSADNFKNL